ncbi:MAG TPA: hypothetical protein VNH65_02580 [Candidatus Acidoferrum sp.]|nr:hypothetical protein [Candidatus Acidoferrum sp.]
MSSILQLLFSGLVGAIIGALLYAWIAWKIIKRQVDAMRLLQRRSQIEQTLTALTALREEMLLNQKQNEGPFKDYLAASFSTEIWGSVVDKVQWKDRVRVESITRVYARVFALLACTKFFSLRPTQAGSDVGGLWEGLQPLFLPALRSLDDELHDHSVELQQIE